MRNSSESESDRADDDIEKLHEIWKNLKQNKGQSKSKQSLGSVKKEIYNEEQKNLEARLKMTEKQLLKSRQNTTLLMKKLSEAEEMIENLQQQVERERMEKEEMIRQTGQQKDEVVRREQEERIKEIEGQLLNFEKKMEMNEKELNSMFLKIKSLQQLKDSKDRQIKGLEQINEGYCRQLSQAEDKINEAYLGTNVNATQLLQLNQAYSTIQRLILLLKSTYEYRQLGDFAEEIKDIHFLKNITKRMKSQGLNHKLSDKKKLCSCMDVKIDERLLWTPTASYKILLDMKIKYQYLTQECIEEVLFELNKIWLAREEAHVKRVRQSYENNVTRLKKKSQQRFDEMVARKQIQRLKKQLQGVKSIQKKSRGVSIQKLKSTGQYEDELKLKQREIKLLQERVKLIETQTLTHHKELYLEGALWIIDKILEELNLNDQDMKTFEGEFRQKIEKNLSIQEWLRSYKLFFENITELHNSLVEKLLTMKESTVKKISGENVKDSCVHIL